MPNIISIPEAFKELFRDSYTYYVFYGGRSGCKSHSIARAVLIYGMQSKQRILCLREYFNSMADSVKSLLDDLIIKYKLEYFYKSTKNSIIGKNGTNIIFGGLKINNKNIKGKEKIDIVWCEEAETISQESWDLLIPTIIRNRGSKIYISFNPYLIDDPVMQFINTGRSDIYCKKVTYKDNPFFTDKEKLEMLHCKKNDYNKYLWIWEGECLNISEAAVFNNKFRIDRFVAPPNTIFYYGLDPGFSNSPLAFLRCYIDDRNKLLYIDKGASKRKLEIDHTPDFLENAIPGCKKENIICDSARPELISYLNRQGFKIKKAKKGKDSVIEGIEFIKNYTVIIHEDLKDVIFEFKNHSYKIDSKTGLILNVFIDEYNHFIDALRYALENVRAPVLKSVVPPPPDFTRYYRK